PATGPGVGFSPAAGRLRIALAISLRPSRSAITMVAEFSPLVERSNCRFSGSGTSSTERYTVRVSPLEMRMVELLMTPFLAPQRGQTPLAPSNFRLHSGHIIADLYPAASLGVFVPSRCSPTYSIMI